MKKSENIFVVILLYSFWIIISGDLSASALVLGLIISVTVDFMIAHSSFTRRLSKKIVIKFIFFIWYSVLVGIEVFKASYEVAYFVLHPKATFKSGIVKIPIEFETKDRLVKSTILSNLITLTPGTVTVDFNNNKSELYVHWLDVKTEDEDEIRKVIIGDFEWIVRRMFE